MDAEERRELLAELERLKQEHRDLDTAIEALLAASTYDRLQVQRLKSTLLAGPPFSASDQLCITQ